MEIANATAETLEAAAAAIEGQTKINIRNQPSAGHTGLIDTGFMVNSVYFVAKSGSSYDKTDKSGKYKNREGQMVERNIQPKANPQGNGALVAIGAEYAIDLEEQYQMLYGAAETVAKHMGGLVKKV